MKKCLNCGKKISNNATKCLKCFQLGKNNSFFGKHHTDKHNKEISKKMIGKANKKHGKRSKLYKVVCLDCKK